MSVDQNTKFKFGIDDAETEFSEFSWQEAHSKFLDFCVEQGFDIPERRRTALREMAMSGKVTVWENP